MTARDNILQRIRTETAGIAPLERPPVPEVWPATNPPRDEMVKCFADSLQLVQGELIRCDSMEDARAKLAELIEQSQWSTIGSIDRPLCHEIAADLSPETVAWQRDDWPPAEIAELSAGLVSAEWLLADTGSCGVVCQTSEQRLMCYLPPACVVVARADQLYEHMPAAWPEIAAATAEPDRRGEFVLITGPSRTADIEKILILGVHGPKRLVVMLID
ncbi:MAG: lactate utilization protein [Candidatus Nealsonbacteria bacterium]|nr:lactate utilization protein [Candidatus Nealsonbacteria bacterium]